MRVLFIDNFDSFTYNLVDEFKVLGCEVKVYRNDIPVEQLDVVLKKFNPGLIVLSPGPSNPKNAGICLELVKKHYKNYPVLGICLGHQCLVEAFGGRVDKTMPVHGKKSMIKHNGSQVFYNVPNRFFAARYHSLYGSYIPDFFEVTALADDIPMAIENKKYRLYGLQFHPESILTTQGSLILKNILGLVK